MLREYRFFNYQCIIKPLFGFDSFYGFYSGVIHFTLLCCKSSDSWTMSHVENGPVKKVIGGYDFFLTQSGLV